MSNSYRKHSIVANTSCESEKQEKRLANRQLRRMVKLRIRVGNYELPHLCEVSNVWLFGKDGKFYLGKLQTKILRK